MFTYLAISRLLTYLSCLTFPIILSIFSVMGQLLLWAFFPTRFPQRKRQSHPGGHFFRQHDHKQYRMFCKPGRGVYAFIAIKLRSIPDFYRNFTYFKVTLHLVEYRQSNNFIMFVTAVLYGKRQSFCWHVNGVHCVHSCILMSCSFQEVTSIPRTDS